MCEIQAIPPAQRLVRWTAIVTYRWPLGLSGAFLAVYGGLVALMLFHVQSGKLHDDARLDAAAITTDAHIVEVRPVDTSLVEGHAAVRLTYEFHTDGKRHEGHSFGANRDYVEGQVGQVELLADSPEINRFAGTRICLLGDMVSPVLTFAVLPGLILLGLWALGAVALRRMLSTGDVAAAEPIRVERVPVVVPTMLRAHYRFRDHHARWRVGRHWVRARSELGLRLSEVPSRFAVVHDRAHPERSRLVLAQDFAQFPRKANEPQAARRA